MRKRVIVLSALCGLSLTSPVWGQRSSLYVRPGGFIPEASASLIYSEAMRPREIKLNDLVTIRVEETGTFTSEGEITRQINSNIDARLRNWLELDGLNLLASPNADLPRARGSYNVQNQSNGELTAKERLAFNITARVVDIRPNGNLVLEARKSLRVDDEVFENSLTGIVRREDIDPSNRVLSEKIAELSVQRRTLGQVRDSYKRGWLARTWDQLTPF